jgi:hypothetical protein
VREARYVGRALEMDPKAIENRTVQVRCVPAGRDDLLKLQSRVLCYDVVEEHTKAVGVQALINVAYAKEQLMNFEIVV